VRPENLQELQAVPRRESKRMAERLKEDPAAWHEYGTLQVSEPLARIPWESFWSYTLVGSFVSLVLPMVLQLFIEFNSIHSVEEIRTGKLKAFRTTDASFLPWGLLLASGFASCFASFYLYMCPRTQDLFMKEAQPSCWVWHKFYRTGRTKKVVRRLFLGGAVFLFSTLPMVAWSDRWIWYTLINDAMLECEKFCDSVRDSHGHGHKIYKQCKDAGLGEFSKDEKDGVIQHPNPLQEFAPNTTAAALTWTGYFRQPLQHPNKECKDIISINATAYIESMVHHGGIFSAFESRFRTANQISVLEIYGAALSIFFWIMMSSRRLALRTKVRTLQDARMELMWTHFMDKRESCYKYRALFRQLFRLYGHFKSDREYVVTHVLKKTADRNAQKQDFEVNIEDFNVGEDDDDDGQIDDLEDKKCCDEDFRENQRSNLLAWLFTLGRAAIPGVCRWWTFSGGSFQPFFGVDEIKPALIVGLVVSIWFNFLWFRQFVHAFVGHQKKFQLAVAFDCLWQFPGGNPIKTVMRDTNPLLEEIKQYHETELNIEDPEQKGNTFFNHNGYRASFGNLHGEALWKEIYKLGEWYHMRRYLQIDKFDERLGMELAMVVALFALVPELCMAIYNWYQLKGDAFMQNVNLVLLWDFTFIIIGVFKALMSTLAFNDLYDQHRKSLKLLRQYIKVEMATSQTHVACLMQGEDNDSGVDMIYSNFHNGPSQAARQSAGTGVADAGNGKPASQKYEGVFAKEFVETFMTALEEFDAPSEFLGVTVNRRVIAAYTSAALVVLTPQLAEILRALCSGD